MTTHTYTQERLVFLRDTYCDKNAAELARRINKDPSYVGRLFYPPNKRGHKGIGLEIMSACNQAFNLPPGFWDQGGDTAPTPQDPSAKDLSGYGRLLGETLDALGMDAPTQRKAFIAATQLLIDHASGYTHPPSVAPVPDAAEATPSQTDQTAP